MTVKGTSTSDSVIVRRSPTPTEASQQERPVLAREEIVVEEGGFRDTPAIVGQFFHAEPVFVSFMDDILSRIKLYASAG